MSDTEDTKVDKCPQLKPTRFKPGQSGNPAGRPKGLKSKKTTINAFLKLFVEGKLDTLPAGQLKEQMEGQGFDCLAAAMAYRKSLLALSRNVRPELQLRAIESIEDRLEGKPTQRTEITGRDGESFEFHFDSKSFEQSLRKLSVEELERYYTALEETNNLIKLGLSRITTEETEEDEDQ